MLKLESRPLIKRFLLFLAVFVPLALLSNLESVKTIHNRYFSSVISPLHNLINPNVYVDFVPEKHHEARNFGVSVYLYNKEKHGKNLSREKFRQTIGSDVIKFPNLNSLVLIPSLLLISLILVSPITFKQKAIRILIGLLLLYLVLIFFFAHSFELFYAGTDYSINSLWRFITSLFGFDNQELINVVVIIVWAGLIGPLMFSKNQELFYQA